MPRHSHKDTHTCKHTHTHLRSRGIQPVVAQPLDGRQPLFCSKWYTALPSLTHSLTNAPTHIHTHTHTHRWMAALTVHFQVIHRTPPLSSFPFLPFSLRPPLLSPSLPSLSLSALAYRPTTLLNPFNTNIQHVISHVSLHLPPPFSHSIQSSHTLAYWPATPLKLFNTYITSHHPTLKSPSIFHKSQNKHPSTRLKTQRQPSHYLTCITPSPLLLLSQRHPLS